MQEMHEVDPWEKTASVFTETGKGER